jgi:hypothetical protein
MNKKFLVSGLVTTSVFVDTACSVTAMTVSGAVAAWMLGRRAKSQ